MNNVPYYLQALAAAVEKLRRQKRDVFDTRLETLTAGQRTLVSAVAVTGWSRLFADALPFLSKGYRFDGDGNVVHGGTMILIR